jgi:hypothetical protein
MTAPTTSAGICPACSSPASGRFCANCGSALEGAACAGCGAALSSGAKFCHRCGTPAGERPASTKAVAGVARNVDNALPWVVASIALLALVALLAGQFFNARGDRGQIAAPPVSPVGPFAGGASGGAGPAPDISAMSPAERAERLFNRIMVLHERNQPDSVQFFAPMALAAYQMIGALDADQRYHLGRIGEITGVAGLARAQADSILQENPTHLLGLILAGSAARLAGNDAEARGFDQRLIQAQRSELAKNLPEYQQHENDIVTAIARGGGR